MIKIAASMLAADFSKIDEEIKKVAPYADMIHVDVMDGKFVANCTLDSQNPKLVKKIKTFHVEATKKPEEVIKKIKSRGKKAGISLDPPTPLEKIKPFLDKVGLVLVMSVNPGQ